MNKLPVGVLETIEDTIDRWNQFSEVIADEKIKDWPSCIRLKDDMSVVETYITQLEAKNAKLTEIIDWLEKNLDESGLALLSVSEIVQILRDWEETEAPTLREVILYERNQRTRS